MNLLFAINGGYIPTFLNCMRSVLLHGGASHYEVFILHSDLTPADEERVRAALPEVGLHFVFVDPAMFDGFPESKRYPRQIYYRIAAPLLLPDQDILTALYGDRVHLLDSMVYNLSDRIFALHNAELRNAPVDLDWVRAHTVIIHYCGRLKPWKPHYVGVLDVFYHELMDEIQKQK